MTVQPATPELDKWLGVKRATAPDALAALTADDMTGPGGLFTDNPLSATRGEVEEAAAKLARLGGWLDYDSLPKATRLMCRGAVQQVLTAFGGDLAEFEAAYRELDKKESDEAFTRQAFEACQSPYGVAKKIIAMWPKMKVKAAPVDYLDGRTVDQLEEEREEGARLRAERRARKEQADREYAERVEAERARRLAIHEELRRKADAK